MTTVYAQFIGNQALVSRIDLERLTELARKTEIVTVQSNDDQIPTIGIMRLAEQGGSFDWLGDEEELYTVDDLKVWYQ